MYFFVFLPAKSFGQKAEFTRHHSYTASNDDSRNSAKAKATQEAQTALLQELGVLVEARQKMTTTAYGGNLRQDFIEELKTYTIGKVQTSVIDGTEKFVENVYSATFSMVVDTADLYGYLDNIIKQKQRAAADSLAKAKKVSDLELAVAAARKSLEQERQREKSLEIVKNQKEIEFNNAQELKNNAQESYDKAAKMRDTERINFEAGALQKYENVYITTRTEYNIAFRNLKEVGDRVETAKNNLRTAENNLAKETGTKPVSQEIRTNRENKASADAAKIKNKRESNNDFVFSFRPEFVIAGIYDKDTVLGTPPKDTSVTSAMANGVGASVELGAIISDSFYFTTELSGGYRYFGGWLNAGYCYDLGFPYIFGVSAGFHNTLIPVEFKRNGKILASKMGQNISFAGVFFKWVFGGGENNIDITTRLLFGRRKNPVAYNQNDGEFVYDDEFNFTCVLSIGYAFIKNKR